MHKLVVSKRSNIDCVQKKIPGRAKVRNRKKMNKSTNKLEVEAVDADEMQRTLPDGNTVYVIRTERGQNVLSLKLEAGDEAEEVVEIQGNRNGSQRN